MLMTPFLFKIILDLWISIIYNTITVKKYLTSSQASLNDGKEQYGRGNECI